MSLHAYRKPRRLIVRKLDGITGLRVPENARLIGNTAVDNGWVAIGTWSKDRTGELFFRLHIMTPPESETPLTAYMYWYVKGEGGEGWRLETRVAKDTSGVWQDFRYLTDLEKTITEGRPLRLASKAS